MYHPGLIRWLLDKNNVPSVVIGVRLLQILLPPNLLPSLLLKHSLHHRCRVCWHWNLHNYDQVKTLDQLEDNLAAVGWSLTEEEMERFENCTEASSDLIQIFKVGCCLCPASSVPIWDDQQAEQGQEKNLSCKWIKHRFDKRFQANWALMATMAPQDFYTFLEG